MAGFTFYEDIEASTVAAHGCTCVLVGSDFARSQTVEQKLEVKGCKRQVANACTIMHMYIGVLDSNRLGSRHRTDTGILVMAW